MLASFAIGARNWLPFAGAMFVILTSVMIWSYWRARTKPMVRLIAASLKLLAISALAICLIEPLFSGTRARPGANMLVLVADNSQSLSVKDQAKSRGERMRAVLTSDADWQTRMEQDFDVRRYQFDQQLRPVADFSAFDFKGKQSSVHRSLGSLAKRYRGRVVAGIVLWTDGQTTDTVDSLDAQALSELPPVYPVVPAKSTPPRDISIGRISTRETNFERAPVTLGVQVNATGFDRQQIMAAVYDEDGKLLSKQDVRLEDEDARHEFRFSVRPPRQGFQFLDVRVFDKASGDPFENDAANPREATIANNRRHIPIENGGGPFRVLYVSGRANWEFKFLNRALQEDTEIQLVGLIRVAKREAKFEFRGRAGETTNPLFRGFGNNKSEDAEQYDQPVMIRIGTKDEKELRGGFPKVAEDLFKYHAIILDDVERPFFKMEQLKLIHRFVNHRGGGLMMLGGMESFDKGKFENTPLGEVLPFYLSRKKFAYSDQEKFRFQLSRDGWLQPWMRLRSTEDAERTRIGKLSPLSTVNHLFRTKPGATVLAHVENEQGTKLPAVAWQRFGKGRTAGFLIGDYWRWSLRRQAVKDDDQAQAWRQAIRWLVSNVPKPVEVEVTKGSESQIQIQVRAHNAQYEPLNHATVQLKIIRPDGKTVEIPSVQPATANGTYRLDYVAQEKGPYRVQATVLGPGGETVGHRESGWYCDPAQAEFESLAINRAWLEQLAKKTGGRVIEESKLSSFVRGLPFERVPVTEPWVYPLWHQPFVFLFAIACLCGEWGLRRWHGLA